MVFDNKLKFLFLFGILFLTVSNVLALEMCNNNTTLTPEGCYFVFNRGGDDTLNGIESRWWASTDFKLYYGADTVDVAVDQEGMLQWIDLDFVFYINSTKITAPIEVNVDEPGTKTLIFNGKNYLELSWPKISNEVVNITVKPLVIVQQKQLTSTPCKDLPNLAGADFGIVSYNIKDITKGCYYTIEYKNNKYLLDNSSLEPGTKMIKKDYIYKNCCLLLNGVETCNDLFLSLGFSGATGLPIKSNLISNINFGTQTKNFTNALSLFNTSEFNLSDGRNNFATVKIEKTGDKSVDVHVIPNCIIKPNEETKQPDPAADPSGDGKGSGSSGDGSAGDNDPSTGNPTGASNNTNTTVKQNPAWSNFFQKLYDGIFGKKTSQINTAATSVCSGFKMYSFDSDWAYACDGVTKVIPCALKDITVGTTNYKADQKRASTEITKFTDPAKTEFTNECNKKKVP